LLLFLLFLFPLAVYCLILGIINRRDRPLLVAGAWDFAGVLFAASGFLIFVGPAVLSAMHEKWRYYWLMGDSNAPAEASYYLWLAVWYLYYAGVAGWAAFMLWRRKSSTAIYNIDVATLEVALARVLERLGLSWVRQGNHYYLKPGTGAADAAELELETFSALSHATLRWHMVEQPQRQEIERELKSVLAASPGHENLAASWFLTVAAVLLLVTLAGMVYIFLGVWRMAR
jgi:hypothetical protein